MSSEPVCLEVERLRSGAGPTSVLDGEALAGAGGSTSTSTYIDNVNTTTCSALLTGLENIVFLNAASHANTSFLCAMAPNQTGGGYIVLPPAPDWIGKTIRFFLGATPTNFITIASNEYQSVGYAHSNISGVLAQIDNGGDASTNVAWHLGSISFTPAESRAGDWFDFTSYGTDYVAIRGLVQTPPSL